MKLTKSKLKQIIKEELNKVLKEYYDEFDSHSDAEHREKWEAIRAAETKREKLQADVLKLQTVLLEREPELGNLDAGDFKLLVTMILQHSGKDPFKEEDLVGEDGLIDMATTLAWTAAPGWASWKKELDIYF